ncbi:MAG: TetR/AcrR family transcriptional regulator C-terminal domain-containing protein [Eubacterium sp.]|nr:TetR/AcrR family transcriptional regulator C-terminal domain-containing protein [Eubacterium sp.]
MSDSNITKNALAASLRLLMKEKNFEKISVSDICDGCNMNRKSFYYHFRDKYDLLNWIFDIDFLENVKIFELSDIDPHENGSEFLWEIIARLADYFYKEKEFYRKALMIEGQNSFKDHFHDSLFPVIRYYFADVVGGEEGDFFTSVMCDTSISALVRWLMEDKPMQPERFVQAFREYLVKLGRRLVNDIEGPTL